MAKICYKQDLAYLKWAESRTGWALDPYGKVWITNLSADDEILGVAFFHSWKPGGAVELGLALHPTVKFLSRSFLKAIFGYGFGTLKVYRLSAVVKVHTGNQKLKWLNTLQRIGGVLEARLKHYYGKDIDGIMVRFTRPDILASKFGRYIFED